MARVSKVYKVSDEEFRIIISQSLSYSECLRKLGLQTRGGKSATILKRRIEELGCSTNHFFPYNVKPVNARYTLDEILVKNSSYANMATLKNRLLKEGVIEYKCVICGNIGEWNNKSLTLQIDHINGINNDHRVENIRLLCPNCHSQTKTFSGKNNKTPAKLNK